MIMKKIYLSLLIAALGMAVGCSTANYGTSGRGYESGSSRDVPMQDRDIHVPPHGGEQLNRIGLRPNASSVTPSQDWDQLRHDYPNQGSSSTFEKGTNQDKG